jgi:hypothetical protein
MGLKYPHINGKAADKLHAQFSYFLNSIPVPGTKKKKKPQYITKTFPPEIPPTQRYRKDLDK